MGHRRDPEDTKGERGARCATRNLCACAADGARFGAVPKARLHERPRGTRFTTDVLEILALVHAHFALAKERDGLVGRVGPCASDGGHSRQERFQTRLWYLEHVSVFLKVIFLERAKISNSAGAAPLARTHTTRHGQERQERQGLKVCQEAGRAHALGQLHLEEAQGLAAG